MKAKALPPLEVLRELFEVLPEEGKLLWRVNKGSRAKVGQEVGKQVTIDYMVYYTYRIICAMAHGDDFDGNVEVDHINRDRTDNSISNLRKVTHAENLRNRGLLSTNTSGYPGVYYCNRKNRKKRWRAGIRFEGKSIYLGIYATLEEAVSARKEAEVKYGFLPAV